MSKQLLKGLEAIRVYPIGSIRRNNQDMRIEVLPSFRPAMLHIDKFSHILVLFWADRNGNLESRNEIELQVKPPYAPDKMTGIFATRSEFRPNPILCTPCKIESVDLQNGIIHVQMIDGFDGSPVLDIKGYYPIMDRVNGAKIPAWLDWGLDHVPDEGLGLYEEMEE